MPIANGDIVQQVTKVRSGSVTGNIVQHFRVQDIGSTTNDTELINAIHDDIVVATLVPLMQPAMTDETVISNATYQKVRPAREGKFNRGITLSGSVAGTDTMPMNSAMLGLLKGLHGSGGVQGRNFWPGVPDTHVEDGRLTPAAKALWQALLDQYPQVLSGGGVQIRYVIETDRTPPLVPADVNIVRGLPDPRIRQLRSRTATL